MHTKTEIELLIQGSSDLTADRKQEILSLLPSFYQLVEDSLLLDDAWKSRILFMLLRLSNEQIHSCSQILVDAQDDIETELVEVLQGQNGVADSFDADLEASKKVLKEGEEILERADETLEMQSMEEDFSDDTHE